MKYPQDDPKIAALITEAQAAREEWDRWQLTGRRNDPRYKEARRRAHVTSHVLYEAKKAFYARKDAGQEA